MKRWCLGIILSFYFLIPRTVLAAALVVSPAYQQVILSKEQKEANFEIKLENKNNFPVSVQFLERDFGSLDDSGGVAFLGEDITGDRKYALASWLSLSNSSLIIGAGESQRLKVRVMNKESLSPGGHYGAIICRMADEENKGEVKISESVAVLIYVNKRGGEIYDLKLKEWWGDYGWRKLGSEIVLRMENQGNVHVIPSGKVSIEDPLGRMVSQGVVNRESGIVLPGSQRKVKVAMEDRLMAFLPGKYQVKIEYRFIGSEEWQTTEKNFFYLGWSGYAIVIIILVVIIPKVWGKNRKKV